MAPVGRTTIPARGRRKTGVWKGHPLTAAFARCLIMSVTHRVTAPLLTLHRTLRLATTSKHLFTTPSSNTLSRRRREKGYEKADEKKGGGLREPSPLQRKAPLQRQD